MAIHYDFYKNNNLGEVKIEPPYEYASVFLMSDVRSDTSIKEIVRIIEQLQNGDLEIDAWRCAYNNNCLTLTSSNAMIEPLNTDIKPCVVPIGDFNQLLKDWLIHISK